MNETSQLIALATAAVSALGALAGALYYLVRYVRTIEIRVSRVTEAVEVAAARSVTTWDFLLQRGEVEAEKGGHLNPDGTLSQNALSRFAGLVAELQDFAHRGEGKLLPRVELAVEIERRWGKRIVAAVCKPLGVSQGACIVMALALCQAPTLHVRPPSV